MAPEAGHDRLLARLRESNVGPPTIPDEDPKELGGKQWKVSFDSLIPLIVGTLRCDMVRGLLATLLGTGVASAGALPYLLGWAGRGKATLLGALGGGLVVWTAVGLPLPGRVPFLEVKTPAGFHCKDSKRNANLKKAFEGWQAGFFPTPWLRSGEWCTALPFFWNPNNATGLKYERVWVKNPNDQEHLATDWVFPPGGHDATRPVVLLLTGLGPDKHWTKTGGFIANTAWYLSTKCNITAVVLVPRGTMDTFVKEKVTHGARLYDVRPVVLLAESAMRSARGEKEDSKTPLPLFASGFSMGAIIIANYCGKFGEDSRLAGVVHFSGMYDGIYNMKFEYSARTWQTYLAYGLKASFFHGRVARIAAKRGVDMKKVLSKETRSVTDIDRVFICPFNNYEGGVEEYYRDMCVGSKGKWKNVKVPVLSVAARDDPITHCDALHAQEFAAGNENLLFLITDRGGHVGWPLGMKPWERGFDFMSEGISVFVEAMLSSEVR